MTRIADILTFFDRWASPAIAETWDTVGLITGDPAHPVNSVLVTLDITEHTIETAASEENSFIIAHHPLIFSPLSTLSGSNRTVRLVRELVRHDIASFAAHTNLDQAPGGVSMALGEQLGLTGLQPLKTGSCRLAKFVTFVPPDHTDRVREAASHAGAGAIGEYTMCSFTSSGTGTFLPAETANPYRGARGELAREPEDRIEMIVPEPFAMDVVNAVKDVHPYEEMAYDVIPLSLSMPSFGYGALGNLPEPHSPESFRRIVGEKLGLDTVISSEGCADSISRVAVMGGSGAKLVTDAVRAGADAYVTGEIGHHTFVDHGSEILLIDGTHDGTERPVLQSIQTRLSQAFPDLAVSIDQQPPPGRAIRL